MFKGDLILPGRSTCFSDGLIGKLIDQVHCRFRA